MPVDSAGLITFLRERANRPMDARELARGLELPASSLAELKDLLTELEDAGVVFRVQRDRFAVPERIHLLLGRLHATRRGDGYVLPEDGSEDVHVATEDLNTAQDGDRVVVRLERRRPGQRPEGRVVRILARARATVVGTFHHRDTGRARYGYVTPSDRKVRWDVLIPAGATGMAEEGQLVVVRITDWGGVARGPAGEIERVLGYLGDPGVDVEAIIHSHELPTEFPPEVEAEAAAVTAAGIASGELAGREDLRRLHVFTIDPADAKDHDDALSIRPLEDGTWEVGVHIADVSHYVTEGGLLDQEAWRRGTSTYLVDRVIPMLPHALSSELCSLRENEDRLALSLLLRLDAAAEVLEHRLVRSLIRSRHKLAYEQAQAILDGTLSLDEETTAALQALLGLSRALRARRQERGSLDFDLPAAHVVLDAAGEPVDVQRAERLEAHRLIEDFMLLANETIARRGAEARAPFMYRVHEKPEEARLEQLRDFAATLGYRLGEGTPRDLQRVLQQAEGRPDGALISTVLLRAMKQARYSAQNLGHFGLAARWYTHFTSPIRRYPDLVVHRLAARMFIDGVAGGVAEDALADVARHSSERERIAADAERDSIDLKKAEFMQRHIGDEFDGTIAGVTGFGCFVLLDRYFVEGLVHVSSLGDDYYAFHEDQYALVGERSGRRLRLGDRVRVSVERVDLDERRIELALAPVDSADGAVKPGRKGPPRRSPPGGGEARKGKKRGGGGPAPPRRGRKR